MDFPPYWCLAFLMPCRMKNGRPLKMPDHLCWQISRGGLPLNLQDFIVERQKTLNLADFILILADLMRLAYFMQQHHRQCHN